MIIYLGADHRGFAIKENIKEFLSNEGYDVIDMGADIYAASDDYPEYAAAVAANVSANPADDRGVVVCGSGVGVDIVANKFIGVRSALVANVDQAVAARRDDDANVLALAADFIDEQAVRDIVHAFLETDFDHGENHQRRIDEIRSLEMPGEAATPGVSETAGAEQPAAEPQEPSA